MIRILEGKWDLINKKNLIILIFLLVFFINTSIISATDYYVSTSGSDSNPGTKDKPWKTPSYAATQAKAGDTIYLRDGTWKDEHVVFANSGTSGNPITLKAYPGETPILDGVDGTDLGIEARGKDYITIDGLTVKSYSSQIYIRDSIGSHVLNCKVYPNSDLSDDSPSGIVVKDDSHYCSIKGNTVKGDAWNSVHIGGRYYGSNGWVQNPSTNILIENNHIYDNQLHNLIDFHGSVNEAIIRNNKLGKEGYKSSGIFFHQGVVEDIEITNNTFIDCGSAGDRVISLTNTKNGYVANNYFDGLTSSTCAIRVYYRDYGGDENPENIIIYNNEIRNIESNYGIFVYGGSSNVRLDSNYIDDPNRQQYRIKADTEIVNPVKSKYGVFSDGGAAKISYTDGRKFSVDGTGEYTTYTITSGTHNIEVIGEKPNPTEPEINSVSITPSCSSEGCKQGEKIKISASLSNIDFRQKVHLQIDAKSDDGTCDIQYAGGDIRGIFTECTSNSCSGEWTIPSVPEKCEGKTLKPHAAAIHYNGPPGTGTGVVWTNTISGSFKFYKESEPKDIVYVAIDGSGDYNCDGTDDQVEINKAINYINNLGGGTVHLKAGTYIIDDSVILKSNVILEGEDIYNIDDPLEGTQSKTIIKIKNQNNQAKWSLIYGDDITNTILQKFTMDGNMGGQSGLDQDDNIDGIRIYNSDKVTIKYITGRNVFTDNFEFYKSEDCLVSYCTAKNGGHELGTIIHSNRITVSDSFAWNLGNVAVRVYDSNYCIIERNKCYTNDYCILVDTEGSGTYGNNIYRDNYLNVGKFGNYEAIRIHAEGKTTIENEQFIGNIIDGSDTKGFNMIVSQEGVMKNIDIVNQKLNELKK